MNLILRFLKPHRKLCAVTIILLIVDVAGALFIPTLVAEMLNDGTSGASFDAILRTGAQMAVISLVAGGCAILGGYTCAALSAQVGRDMREAVYAKSLKLSVYDFRQFGTASITTRTISDITTIQFALTSTIQMVIPVPVICVLALALTFGLDAQMGVILLIVVAAVLLLAWRIMGSASPLFRKLQKLLDRMSTVLLENITGVRVVRAFNNEIREEGRMITAFSNYAATSIKANRLFANLDGLSFFCINLFVVVVYWLSGAHISSGNLQIGDITALIEYAMMVLFFLMMAQMVILTLPRALECCERVRLVLDHTPEIVDLVDRDPEEDSSNPEVLAFRDVSFRFKDAEEDTLGHLNFVCRRGETTAIIGGTGSGKSTVASLILRFHDVTDGAIELNGTDIRDMTQQFLRDHLAYVQQKAWLFSGTIAENLRYSRPDAAEEELMHAADVAQAGDFIRSLPDGLQSHVAQGGTNFSGGQKQLLTIARVFLCDPPILILDEATSSVDTRTEAEIGRAMGDLMRGRTSFVIAHRLSTIRDADNILFMENGNIIEQGDHRTLLEKKGAYAALYDSQFE
ncbi:ABC transporter ATP-binding protein [Oscillibacter valericigenes]|uniref:ABC transporter ATP-binding protein n=1 Tax=Oscillibacter valericigenes TaxID=351091 RepID=UPI001957D1E2|nr:ABC transporter ATP-binding protein [Oscillibacter valericigenes]MBM6910433.1 ABC transporter ATP-binding protein [Oscillibacter valericigenes]